MIYMGVDLHLRFCVVTVLDASGRVLQQTRVANDAASWSHYLERWSEPVAMAAEACTFATAFAERVRPRVARLVLAHPQRVKAIASAKLKNDRVDSATLAHLLRADLLPESWISDPATGELREQVRLRASLVTQRTRWKNRVHALLHRYGQRAPDSDLFGRAGRSWLEAIELPAGARQQVDTHLRMIDAVNGELQSLDATLGAVAEADADVHGLMTIPGIGPFSALVLKAEIGDVHRFREKRALYSYAGLVPRVRESAGHRFRGSITRAGSPLLRWVLVEAAMNAARSSRAARNYFERLAQRKPRAVARVALARKLLGAVWALWTHGVLFDENEFAARQR